MGVWDTSTYELDKCKGREVKVVLHGSSVSGRLVLLPTRGRNWMAHRMDHGPATWTPLPRTLHPMLALAGDLPATKGRSVGSCTVWPGSAATCPQPRDGPTR